MLRSSINPSITPCPLRSGWPGAALSLSTSQGARPGSPPWVQPIDPQGPWKELVDGQGHFAPCHLQVPAVLPDAGLWIGMRKEPAKGRGERREAGYPLRKRMDQGARSQLGPVMGRAGAVTTSLSQGYGALDHASMQSIRWMHRTSPGGASRWAPCPPLLSLSQNMATREKSFKSPMSKVISQHPPRIDSPKPPH